MNGPMEWVAAIGTMIAAALVALDLGRRASGWGFVLFSAVSALWIAIGVMKGATSILVMNCVLLAINLTGVWQYLLSAKNKKVMERVEPVKERIEKDVEREMDGKGPASR